MIWSARSLLAQPVITQQPTNQTALNGSMAVLSVQVSGTGPFTYQWQLNGTNLPNNIITTVAGGGTNYSVHGIMATNARLRFPNSAILDYSGNLLIADGNLILKVTPNGMTSILAGGGTNNPGDGGLASNAVLMRATGVAIDSDGNILVADYDASRIRKIATNGIISTVGGGGFSRPSGILATNAMIQAADVAVDEAGDLFIAGFNFNTVYQVDTNGIITTFAGGGEAYPGDGGMATNAFIGTPQGLALDGSGNLYIAPAGEPRVLKVDTNHVISTIAGGGVNYPGDGGMATNANVSPPPAGIAVDAQGNLFFSEGNWVQEVDTNGILTTVAGNGDPKYSGDGGAATNASLYEPQRVSVDAAGNLFIADSGNNRIREVALAGSPTLTLNNLTVNNAGVYSVTVTSPAGRVTSSNAALTVVVPPSISAVSSAEGTFSLAWSAQAKFTYQLQYTTNLAAPVWQNLGSPITATNGTVASSDIPGADLQRFYRVQWAQ
jgi:hypothetical protein